ncbi:MULTISPECIES: hypothetical protein [Pedobacter]|uniref:hypothetical protein n=1 Tax=Pedobacter TaxID=84567 RepID=UPI00210DDE61|nr:MULTISPECIES: hypothetical protein [unclassified Pedobacter]
MKVRLTPLNIVTALCLVTAGWLLLKGGEQQSEHIDISWTIAALAILSAFVSFLSDQAFRKFVPSLRKLWLLEGVLILFVIIVVFIVKASIS